MKDLYQSLYRRLHSRVLSIALLYLGYRFYQRFLYLFLYDLLHIKLIKNNNNNNNNVELQASQQSKKESNNSNSSSHGMTLSNYKPFHLLSWKLLIPQKVFQMLHKVRSLCNRMVQRIGAFLGLSNGYRGAETSRALTEVEELQDCLVCADGNDNGNGEANGNGNSSFISHLLDDDVDIIANEDYLSYANQFMLKSLRFLIGFNVASFAYQMFLPKEGSDLLFMKQSKENVKHPGTAPDRNYIADINRNIRFESRFTQFDEKKMKEFDYIVVGSGPSGSSVARKLALSKNKSVLIIECGGEAHRSEFVSQPYHGEELIKSEVDWCYQTNPNNDLLPKGRIIDIPLGKSLGGSSVMGYSTWNFGESIQNTFDNMKIDGWKFEQISDSLKEINQLASAYPPNPALEESQKFIKHASSLKYSDAKVLQRNITPDGLRENSFSKLIEPLVCANQKGLSVLSEAYVDSIEFEKKNLIAQPKAIGVNVILSNGRKQFIAANKEVILACGAIGTPLLLQRSGVGESSHLRSHGILPVVSSPEVGSNLKDVVQVSMFVPTESSLDFRSDSTGLHAETSIKVGKDNKIQLLQSSRLNPKGLFPRQMVEQASNFVASISNIPYISSGQPGSTFKSFQFWELGYQTVLDSSQLISKMNMMDEVYRRLYGIIIKSYSNKMNGSVKFISGTKEKDDDAKPSYINTFLGKNVKYALPSVEYEYSKEVIDNLVEGVKKGIDLIITSNPGSETHISFMIPNRSNDESIREFVLSRLTTGNLPYGSVQMGNHESSPCDSKGKVKGVIGVRVADLSLLPSLPEFATGVPLSLLVGNRIAQFILSESNELKVDQNPISKTNDSVVAKDTKSVKQDVLASAPTSIPTPTPSKQEQPSPIQQQTSKL